MWEINTENFLVEERNYQTWFWTDEENITKDITNLTAWGHTHECYAESESRMVLTAGDRSFLCTQMPRRALVCKNCFSKKWWIIFLSEIHYFKFKQECLLCSILEYIFAFSILVLFALFIKKKVGWGKTNDRSEYQMDFKIMTLKYWCLKYKYKEL